MATEWECQKGAEYNKGSSAKRKLLVRAGEGSEGQHRPDLSPHDSVQLHTAEREPHG